MIKSTNTIKLNDNIEDSIHYNIVDDALFEQYKKVVTKISSDEILLDDNMEYPNHKHVQNFQLNVCTNTIDIYFGSLMEYYKICYMNKYEYNICADMILFVVVNELFIQINNNKSLFKNIINDKTIIRKNIDITIEELINEANIFIVNKDLFNLLRTIKFSNTPDNFNDILTISIINNKTLCTRKIMDLNKEKTLDININVKYSITDWDILIFAITKIYDIIRKNSLNSKCTRYLQNCIKIVNEIKSSETINISTIQKLYINDTNTNNINHVLYKKFNIDYYNIYVIGLCTSKIVNNISTPQYTICNYSVPKTYVISLLC